MRSMMLGAVVAMTLAGVACSPARPQQAAAAYIPSPAEVEAEKAGTLSALAPANLAKPRPAPPFDVTGNWFIDISQHTHQS